MKRIVLISDIVVGPFLLPQKLACDALGLARHRDLVVGLASGRYKGGTLT